MIALHISFALYGFTISLTQTLMNIIASDVEPIINYPFYITVFLYFTPALSILSLLVMMITSAVQSIINFHIGLEQICILVDEL